MNSKCEYKKNCESEVEKLNNASSFFTNESIMVINKLSNLQRLQQFRLLSISNLRRVNCSNDSYNCLILLSGDIEINPGPVRYPCTSCKKSVTKNQKGTSCNCCGLWSHKKCENLTDQQYKLLLNTPKNEYYYICNSCQIKNINSNDSFVEDPNEINTSPCQYRHLDDGISEENHEAHNKSQDFNFFDQLPFHKESFTGITIDNEEPVLNAPSTYNELKFFSKRGIHFIHLNINSILSKIEELRQIALETKITVIGISESKLDSSVTDEEVNIPGYEIIRGDRNRKGGGVAAYILKDVTYNIREDFKTKNEAIFFEILLPRSKPILVGIVYRPPKQTNFIQNFDQDLTSCIGFNEQEVYILGDFNINLLISEEKKAVSTMIKRYKEFCSLHGLKQLIVNATRITKNSSSLLDHILTNSQDRVSQSGIIQMSLSDHQIIYCTRKITRIVYNKHKTVKMRSLKNYNKEIFIEALINSNIPDIKKYSDVNNAYSDFTDSLISIIDNIATLKNIRVKNNSQEWFDAEIHEEIIKREKCFSNFKKTRTITDEKLYHDTRNRVQALIKNKKEKFVEENIKQNQNNSKSLWKTIKQLGLPSASSPSGRICLDMNGEKIFDATENAKTFNDFYSKLAEDLIEKLPEPPNKYKSNSVKRFYEGLKLEDKKFNFQPIDQSVVLNLLNNINCSKAPGLDNLSGMFLRDGADVLSTPITELINLSISSCTFPDKCKIAKIKPLFKKGSKTEPGNYRPISLLPLISKIFERVIHNQLQAYLNEKKILYQFQSGFRTNFSTDSCLSYLHDKILKGFDCGKYTGMILIDLQKAFDTIDHEILLNKLVYLGLSNEVVNWFKSYLTKRLNYVQIANKLSTSSIVTCGVPQGSILGPLLFLIYVNDMSQSVDCELLLYADDSCLIFSDKDTKNIETALNVNFSSLCDWFVDNKLSIHLGKTESILFGTRRRLNKQGTLNITYKDKIVKQKTHVKYLGCILDDVLSGNNMASHILSKVNGKLKFLYRKQNFLNKTTRRLICNALIQPHFDYACSSWYPLLTQGLKNKIQILQNKCIRYCLKLDNRDHIGISELKEINWLPVKKRVEQNISGMIFKLFKEQVPVYLGHMFRIKNLIHNTRRSKFSLHIPLCKTFYGQKAISYMAPKIWDKIPVKIKSGLNINTFKHAIKKWFFKTEQIKESSDFFYYGEAKVCWYD